MTGGVWLFLIIVVIMPLVVFLPVVLISQRRLKKRLAEDEEYREKYAGEVLEGNIVGVIPLSLFLFFFSLFGFIQLIFPAVNNVLPFIFPKIGLNYSFIALIGGCVVMLYSYFSLRKSLTSWKGMLWIVFLSFFLCAIALIQAGLAIYFRQQTR